MKCPHDPGKTRLPMALLTRVARVRGKDFLPAILAAGAVTPDGRYVDIDRAKWTRELAAHAPPGLGDAIALAARPAAALLDKATAALLPPAAGTHLADCHGCHGPDGNGGRQAGLNRALHF